MTNLNISVPDSTRAWIDARIECGESVNASDYICDLIRQDQRARDTIRRALIEGEKSGKSSRSVKQIAQRTRRNLRRA